MRKAAFTLQNQSMANKTLLGVNELEYGLQKGVFQVRKNPGFSMGFGWVFDGVSVYTSIA